MTMAPATGSAALRVALDQLPPHVARIDDLADVDTQVERRRIQNRLNQRALRKRKREAGKQIQHDYLPPTGDSVKQVKLAVQGPNVSRRPEPSHREADGEIRRTNVRLQDLGFWESVASAMSTTPINYRALLQAIQSFPIGEEDMPRLLNGYKQWVQARFTSPSPRSDTLFTLVQFNVFRALDCNARLLFLSRTHAFADDSESIMADPRYLNPDGIAPPLRPTHLQRTVSHHPWIDLLPLPRMRDNLIRAGESYDEEALCNGLVGCGSDTGDRMGMLVWGQPWDPAGWELTEEFLERWGWTVAGCRELFESTNHWRKKRGVGMLRLGEQ